MKIINTKIEDLLKFPFEERDWVNTFGIYVVISLFSGIMLIMAFFFLFVGGTFILEGLNIGILLSLPFFILLISFFIINLYLQGYVLEILKNIKEKKKNTKPEHKNIASKFKLGLVRFVLSLGPTVIVIFFVTTSIVTITWGIYSMETTTSLAVTSIILGSLIGLISILTIIVVNIMIIPSMIYIYLETNSISKAYNPSKILSIIRNAWKEFLIIYAVSLLTSIIISAVGQIPCIGAIIILLGTAYIVFIIALLTGKIFVELDKLKPLKK